MQHVDTDDAQWIPIREASRKFDIPIRTLYACIERRTLDTRKVGRTLHVQPEHVARVASSRAADNRTTSPESPGIAAARERVTATHLEAQQLQAAATVERSREELSEAEAERLRRRELISLQIERERHALERDRADLRRAEEERSERARRAIQLQAAERERDRDRKERMQQQEQSASERRTWEQRWVTWALDWIEPRTGSRPPRDEALALVRQGLTSMLPTDPHDVVAAALADDLRLRLAGAIAERDRQRLAELRTALAEAIALASVGLSADYAAAFRVARAAADFVDPTSTVGQVTVIVAVRLAFGS